MAEKSEGEIYEGIAFQFCKIATFALVFGPWTLTTASSLGSILFLVAYAKGIRVSRCFLKYPLLVSAVLALVCAGSLWWRLR